MTGKKSGYYNVKETNILFLAQNQKGHADILSIFPVGKP